MNQILRKKELSKLVGKKEKKYLKREESHKIVHFADNDYHGSGALDSFYEPLFGNSIIGLWVCVGSQQH